MESIRNEKTAHGINHGQGNGASRLCVCKICNQFVGFLVVELSVLRVEMLIFFGVVYSHDRMIEGDTSIRVCMGIVYIHINKLDGMQILPDIQIEHHIFNSIWLLNGSCGRFYAYVIYIG